MKGSLIIVAFFVLGLLLARWGILPAELVENDFSMYALYGLMFLVGMSVGSDTKALKALKEDCIGPIGYDPGHVGWQRFGGLGITGTKFDRLFGGRFRFWVLFPVFRFYYRVPGS